MPGYLFHMGATAMCPHGGQISVVTTNQRVLVGGQPVATMSDQFLIAGCPFTIPLAKPEPCLRVQWLTPAMRILINCSPPILQSSIGLCLNPEQAPQGPPNVIMTQMRVMGQ